MNPSHTSSGFSSSLNQEATSSVDAEVMMYTVSVKGHSGTSNAVILMRTSATSSRAAILYKERVKHAGLRGSSKIAADASHAIITLKEVGDGN